MMNKFSFILLRIETSGLALGKLADRAFSRQGKNEKFSRQFFHNW